MNFTMYSGFYGMVAAGGIEKAAEYAKNLGFSSVEFLDFTGVARPPVIATREDAKRVRDTLEKYGLSVACYSVYANLWKSERTERDLIDHTRIAAELGSPYLHHTILPWMNIPENLSERQKVFDEVLPSVVRVADAATEVGITCLYEEQGFFVNGVEDYGNFYRAVKKQCGHVGVCGDLGNILFVDENADVFFREFIGEIKHVHVKDYLRQSALQSPGNGWMRTKNGDWLLDTRIGNGVVKIEECIRLLRAAGYQGKFAMELCFTEGYEEAASQAMNYLEELWNK